VLRRDGASAVGVPVGAGAAIPPVGCAIGPAAGGSGGGVGSDPQPASRMPTRAASQRDRTAMHLGMGDLLGVPSYHACHGAVCHAAPISFC
jgi:hypothetical protein